MLTVQAILSLFKKKHIVSVIHSAL